jgi:hypothetical protein
MAEDPIAALEYIKDVYSSEREWYLAYEEKVLRYQTISGSVLGAGALGLSQVQFALGPVLGTGAGKAFVLFAGVTLIAALWGMIASLFAMRAVDLLRPPAGDKTLRAIATGNPTHIMDLALKYGEATQKIRDHNVTRSGLLRQAWRAAAIAVVAGALSLVVAVFVRWPRVP